MCYSAMVKQDLKKLGMQFHARTDLALFEELFTRRKKGEKVAVKKALELNFQNPQSTEEKKIAKLISSYNEELISQTEKELFEAKSRLSKAQNSLEQKKTLKAEKEIGVAERLVERKSRRLESLKREKEVKTDSRIYPFDYAPVIISENSKRMIVPMRYHLRPPGEKESFDRLRPGCYNARRDNLTQFWKNQFGKKHGAIIVTSFFENVKRHDFEKRKLKPGEQEENMILEFSPRGIDQMIIPCIWDTWKGSEGQFDGFAIITDEPPKEVAATGHNRCPIFLKESNLDKWLNPQSLSKEELFALFDDRETPYYDHAIAA